MLIKHSLRAIAITFAFTALAIAAEPDTQPAPGRIADAPTDLITPDRLRLKHRFGLKTTRDAAWNARDNLKRLGYSNGVFCLADDGKSIVVMGHDHGDYASRFRIPTEGLSTEPGKVVGVQIEDWKDYLQGNKRDVGAGNVEVRGLQEVDGQIAYMAQDYYNADSSNDPCFGIGEAGLFRVATHSQATAGFLAEVDPDWQERFGGNLFTGLAGTTIHALSSFGPPYIVLDVDPDKLPDGDAALPARRLQFYTLKEPHDTWNYLSRINGAAHVGNSVLHFGWSARGVVGYGEAKSFPGSDGKMYSNPCGGAKGFHSSEGTEAVMWVTDARDLLRVAEGKLDAKDVPTRKYRLNEVLELDEGWKCARIRGAAFDRKRGLIYISVSDLRIKRTSEPRPEIIVLEIVDR